MHRYTFKLEHKSQLIEMKGNQPRLFVSCVRVDSYSAFPEFSNKQLVCRIYNAILDSIKATPRGYYKSLAFKEIVPALNHLIQTATLAATVRNSNMGYGNSKAREDVRAEIHSVVRAAIDDFDWRKKFTDPEKWVIHSLSNAHIGREIDEFDLECCFDPIKDDTSRVTAKVQEFEAFPFDKYLHKSEVKRVRAHMQDIHKGVQANIETFRKMRDIAGTDLVNWGDHKYASRKKRHNIGDSYVARQWLLHTYKNYLIEKKAVKPAVKKESSIVKLRERFDLTPDSISQNDLVRLLKAGTASQAGAYIAYMTPGVAVSLLSIGTMNVGNKLAGNSVCGMRAIVSKVASGHNPKEFRTLLAHLNVNSLIDNATWELFQNHVGHFSIEEFVAFARSGHITITKPSLDSEFYNKVLIQIPAHDRYRLHSGVTHAFLKHAASAQDKIDLIRELATRESSIMINWELSHAEFREVPWKELRKAIWNFDYNSISTYYADLAAKNKDVELAEAMLVGAGRLAPEQTDILFSLFNFDNKIKILEKSGRNNLKIADIFNENELEQFAHIALTSEKLCAYALQLPVSNISAAVVTADVTARVTGGELHLPLTDKIVRALSKDAAKRLVARGKVAAPYYTRYAELEVLYSKLTRQELLEAIQVPIAGHPDATCMTKHMTADELVACARGQKDFFRTHIERLPDSFIAEFKNKERFKGAVGDRRNHLNDAFARDLEARLSKLTDNKAAA